VIEADLAVTADLGTLQRLPVIVGHANAMELALTGRVFDGKEAKQLGLVKGLFSSKEELDKGVREIASQIAKKSPLAIVGTKAVLLKSRDLTVDEGLEWVGIWNAAHLWSGEVNEAIEAKKGKRQPIFAKL
jgi:delta(3,5)-delta(2,4)-dienoyl-CoA isomerase